LYTVTVIDSNGCTRDSVVEVIIYQQPPQVTEIDTIVIGQTIEIGQDLGTGYTYDWTPTEDLSCEDCALPIAQPLVDRLYTVTIADILGCFSVPSTYEIIVKPVTTIDVPTAFTPNGDLRNDIIFVNGWGVKNLIEFKIYNRWGQLVYENPDQDINKGWDGYFKGKIQNEDTYTYTAIVETWLNGSVLTKTGSFLLLK
jgi:gliding motility-associated-like protein